MPLFQNRLPSALRQAGEEVKVHDEHFRQNTEDEVWLEKVGKQGWIVLTKDSRIRYHANEVNALWKARVRAFVLTARGDLQGKEMATIFIKALVSMKKLATETPPPFIAHVNRDGRVILIRGGNIK